MSCQVDVRIIQKGFSRELKKTCGICYLELTVLAILNNIANRLIVSMTSRVHSLVRSRGVLIFVTVFLFLSLIGK